MKIKCPFWNDCFAELEPGELFVHLKTEHHAGEITHAFWEQYMKIHEKIKELDVQGEYDFRHGYPSSCTDTQIDLLKSLLK